MREHVVGRLDPVEGAFLGQQLARAVFGIARTMHGRLDLDLDHPPCLFLLRASEVAPSSGDVDRAKAPPTPSPSSGAEGLANAEDSRVADDVDSRMTISVAQHRDIT
jgi:hypothetical protein